MPCVTIRYWSESILTNILIDHWWIRYTTYSTSHGSLMKILGTNLKQGSRSNMLNIVVDVSTCWKFCSSSDWCSRIIEGSRGLSKRFPLRLIGLGPRPWTKNISWLIISLVVGIFVETYVLHSDPSDRTSNFFLFLIAIFPDVTFNTISLFI